VILNSSTASLPQTAHRLGRPGKPKDKSQWKLRHENGERSSPVTVEYFDVIFEKLN